MTQDNFPLIYSFHFYLFSVIALASAITFVTRKSPVAAALWLVNTMFCLAALYVMLDAPFIGAIQILVYAGAIMVVFLFVVMLLNLGHPSDILDVRSGWARLGAGAFGALLLAELAMVTGARIPRELIQPGFSAVEQAAKYGAIGSVARPLFTDYLLAFELTSVLLLVAIAGAIVLGKRRGRDAR